MRVLLDENFPVPLVKDFLVHECAHVIPLGWAGTLNGTLLDKAEEAGFEALVTFDDDIHQRPRHQPTQDRRLVVKPEGQGVPNTRALIGEILVALGSCRPGQVLTFTNRRGPSR